MLSIETVILIGIHFSCIVLGFYAGRNFETNNVISLINIVIKQNEKYLPLDKREIYNQALMRFKVFYVSTSDKRISKLLEYFVKKGK